MDESTPVDTESVAYKVINRFGSNAAFARALGRTHSTTDKWLKRGFFPPEEHEAIVRAGREQGIKFKPTDFVDRRIFDAPGA